MPVTAFPRFCAILFFLVIFMSVPFDNVYAMHIMEGYLPLSWSVFWSLAALPFIVWGVITIRRNIDSAPKYLVLLAMCGAFAFVLSALKLPSVTGSCSHPTGVGLGAVLFGAAPMSVIGLIILLFQAILLAHGGLTTLGANVFSMAVVGPFVAYFTFKIFKPRFGGSVAVFLAAFMGDIITYVMTSVQLSLAFPDATGGVTASFIKFAGIFALTQLPLAISEGLLTVVVYGVLVKYGSKELGELRGGAAI